MLLALAAGLALLAGYLPAQAQPNLRSSFPGRRVGAATRGDCTARPIVHLVPASSVFAPGQTRLLGLLEGPSGNPRPIQISFQAETGSTSPTPSKLSIPPSGAGILLLRLPQGPMPMRWESSYQCEPEGAAPPDDPLAFITAGSPAALSLLVADATQDDKALQQVLLGLNRACGGSIDKAELTSRFGLADLLREDWPARLPIRCLN